MGQPRRRRARHKGCAMMNWMQLASPWRSPGGVRDVSDVRARPRYMLPIHTHVHTWHLLVRDFVGARLLNDSLGFCTRQWLTFAHVPCSHTLTAKSANSEIKLRITSTTAAAAATAAATSKGRFARLYDSQLLLQRRARGCARGARKWKEVSKWLAYETTFPLTPWFFSFTEESIYPVLP